MSSPAKNESYSSALQSGISPSSSLLTKYNQLPAIRIFIKGTEISKYSNQKNTLEEITKYKSNLEVKKIKFIKLTDNCILIATDDEATHALLTKDWPLEAFGGIIELKISKQKAESNNKANSNSLLLQLNGIHQDIALDDSNLANLLETMGLKNPLRIKNSKNQPTKIIQAEACSMESYNAAINLTNYLYCSPIKCTPISPPINQCFKCQLLGHSASNCKNNSRCVRCAGPHCYKTKGELTCPQLDPIKCVNCGKSHFACSRECPYLSNERFVPINPSLDQTKHRQDFIRKYSEQQHLRNLQPLMALTISPSESLLFKEIKEMVKSELSKQLESTKALINSELEPIKEKAKETQQANKSLKETISNLIREELSTFTNTIRTQLLNELKPKLHNEVKNSLIKTFIDSKKEAASITIKTSNSSTTNPIPATTTVLATQTPLKSTQASSSSSSTAPSQLPVSTNNHPNHTNSNIQRNRYTAPLVTDSSNKIKLTSPILHSDLQADKNSTQSSQLALTPTTHQNTIHNAKLINSHVNAK